MNARSQSIRENLRPQAPRLKGEMALLADLLVELEELGDTEGLRQVIADAANRLARLAR